MRKNSILLPMVAIGTIFFFIGFSMGINSYLIPYLRSAFDLSAMQSYLVLASVYAAFVVFGYPSGIIISRIGYRKSMFNSFLLFALGFLLFIPSAIYQSFVCFLLASFICGIGNTLLQASVNPYITILGPVESAARRISIMGILNKLAWAAAPLFLSLFLDLNNILLTDIYTPFLLISLGFVLLGWALLKIKFPEVEPLTEDDAEVTISRTSEEKGLLNYPNLLLGILALFLYSGVEAITLASIVDYAGYNHFENPEKYAFYPVISMVIGYGLGILMIPNKVSQIKAFQICSLSGVIFSILIISLPGNYSILFVALLGFSNSIMWPAIWPLAINGLGKYTQKGASLLVMGIVGGAVFPLLFGWMADIKAGTNGFPDIHYAYRICLPLYFYLLYYACKGYKVRRKKHE